MEYKILINKEAKPVLQLEDGSEVRFKDFEAVRDLIFELYNCREGAFQVFKVGQTFPLPENMRVSWEYQIKSLLREHDWNKINEKNYNDCLNSSAARMVRKLAILSTEPAASEVQQGGETDGSNVIKILGELNESIYKLQKNKALTPAQVERVIDWMNEWEQLKGTAIPIRFKEDFDPLSNK